VTPIEELVVASAGGDQDAWSELVSRYTPLVLSVARRFELSGADAADVNQTVWLRLVEHLDRIREPAALPMWIARTTRHECIRLQRVSRMTRSFDPLDAAHPAQYSVAALRDDRSVDDDLLRAERHQALRDGFAQLPPRCQELLAMMLREPPLSYGEIGEELRIPIGSVGPTRGRCLHKLRRCPAMVAFAGAVEGAAAAKEGCHDAVVGR
jgi:RNA polymerase sigma factor (sigma-70 family)